MTVSRETLCEGKQIENIPVDLIRRSPYQPRKQFDQGKLTELAESIRANGLLQPITVRKLPSGEYELIACARSNVSNIIRLLDLPEKVQNLIASGELTSTHGKVLLSTKAAELPLNTIIQLAVQCSREGWSSRFLEKKLNTDNQQPSYSVNNDIQKLEKALSDELCIPVTISFSTSTHQSTLTFQLDSLAIMQGLLDRLDFDYNKFSS